MKSPVSRILIRGLADLGLILGAFVLTSAYDEAPFGTRIVSKFLILLVILLLVTGLRAGIRRLVHGRGGANWDRHTWDRVVLAAERHAEKQSEDPGIEERKKAALRAIDRDVKTRDLIEAGELLPYDALRPYFEQRPQQPAPSRTGPPMRMPKQPVPSQPQVPPTPAASAPEGEVD